MTIKTHIRIGTRKSLLARTQSQHVANMLMAENEGISTELVTFDTTGDTILDRNLSDIGGKGLFTKELEEGLLSGIIDLAVHSLKDVPAVLPTGLIINCIPKREDARDAFISKAYPSLFDLPPQSVVGTSSSRRAAQLHALRPDIQIVPFRGNVQTRLQKLDEKKADATFLAVAGLNRLDLSQHITEALDPSTMLPAVGQGALAIEICQTNSFIASLLSPLNHADTSYCTTAERSFLATLEGSCRTPIAAHALVIDHTLILDCLIASMDGKSIYKTNRKGSIHDAKALGADAALELKSLAGDQLLQSWK
jgi:hydroxymethylbilane synthase